MGPNRQSHWYLNSETYYYYLFVLVWASKSPVPWRKKNPLLPRKNPTACPARVARNTPTLNDMTASMTRYNNPIFNAWIAVSITALEVVEPDWLTRLEKAVSVSATAARKKINRRDRRYMPIPELPGQEGNRMRASFPQKKVMCIIMPWPWFPMDMGMVDGGGLMLVPVPPIELPSPCPIPSIVFVLLGGVSMEIMSFSVGDIKGNEMRKSRKGNGNIKLCALREKRWSIDWAFGRTGSGLFFRVSNSDFFILEKRNLVWRSDLGIRILH